MTKLFVALLTFFGAIALIRSCAPSTMIKTLPLNMGGYTVTWALFLALVCVVLAWRRMKGK